MLKGFWPTAYWSGYWPTDYWPDVAIAVTGRGLPVVCGTLGGLTFALKVVVGGQGRELALAAGAGPAGRELALAAPVGAQGRELAGSPQTGSW